MKIKRYLVSDMQEAYMAIRKELGPEAVIISTRRVRQPGWRGLFRPPKLEVVAAVEAKPASIEVKGGRLEEEIAEIKKSLEKLVSANRGTGGPLGHYRQLMLAQDMGEELVEELLTGLDEALKPEVMGEAILARLAQHLSAPKAPKGPEGKIRVLVGPTGVGKTTTLAKLAAKFSLYRRQQVGLITLDTYRIGAVEQLRTYADIMGLPLEVAMTPQELKGAVNKLGHCDVILIDTAGRPPDNRAQLAEIAGFLAAIRPVEVYLVLSGTTRSKDLLKAVEGYRHLELDYFIFTKLDETTCPGVIARMVQATGIPVAYITTGQNVPDDLEEADPYSLAQLIWKAVTANGSGSTPA
ncbi:MAG: flagellar biosynthesis protein FlhF [Thermanaeromonas sp.]|uniref:flagellar biosynthesis protein FlhF n=1 Tax=Thermanaeromonas sp. TaxID=2003697 RepID=UPI0024408B0A|nr:flagellar biosynthesis protein FlhF [Thermanaeromonas sp.]MCG0278133.1 flagellar biosynthesis protein FlhF [Thermanaeromonas sp.]